MRGTVIKRGRSWSVVIDVGRDDAGKRIRHWHSGFGSKKDAERARVELLSRVDRGAYVAPTKTTLGSFLVEEWLPAKRSTVKATTFASYEMHIMKHIKPRIGAVPLLGLTAARLNSFYAELLSVGSGAGDRRLSTTSVRRVHSTLHKALADAVRWGCIARNPADQSDPPRARSPEMRIWTPDQLRAFVESVRGDRLYAAWMLAATTGMRRGELLGLRWSDVDLEAATLTVNQIRTVVAYEVVTLTPKTDKGRRTIALDGKTLSALRAHRVAQNGERLMLGPAYTNDGDLVFTRPDGSGIHPERLSRWFGQRCRTAGLPAIRLHDVRHSYVTALLASGVPLKVVSQRVGHASPMVTMAIYQHVLPGDDRAAADIGARAILGSA
jgi:integrase